MDRKSGQNKASDITIPSIAMKAKLGKVTRGWQPYIVRDSDIKWSDADLILHGVARKQFANLDAFVAAFDNHYPDGDSFRRQFYLKLGDYSDYNTQNPSQYHDVYLDNLKQWYAENEEKAEPAIALAAFQLYLAWDARGNGFANTVTDEGWAGFRKHVELAKEVLENAPEAAKNDPHYYCLWISIHLAQGGDIVEAQKAFEAGQKIDASYKSLYTRMTNFLQPKWFGEKSSDWHTWLVEVLKSSQLSEEDASVLYGMVVRNNLRTRNYEQAYRESQTVYQKYGIDKKRFMAGLVACCKRFPDSSDWPSAYLYHAVRAESKSSIKESLELMDHKFAPGVFGGQKKFFVLIDAITEYYPDFKPLVK